MTPSPMPATPPFSAITPNVIQVERSKEYQTALAESLLPALSPEQVLCEWDILGQSGQLEYVWAVCQGVSSDTIVNFPTFSIPAVIHLEADGSPKNVEFPNALMYHNGDIQKMFPMDLKEIFAYHDFGGAKKMLDRIKWRREHPEIPPLIVLLATPAP